MHDVWDVITTLGLDILRNQTRMALTFRKSNALSCMLLVQTFRYVQLF